MLGFSAFNLTCSPTDPLGSALHEHSGCGLGEDVLIHRSRTLPRSTASVAHEHRVSDSVLRWRVEAPGHNHLAVNAVVFKVH
jgi:hypothetical protein